MWKIFKKEFLELTRDRKTLIFAVVFPTLLMPALMFGFTAFAAKKTQEEQSKSLSYAIFGAQHFEQLAAALERDEKYQLKSIESQEVIKESISDEAIDFALVIPEGTDRTLAEGKPAKVELYHSAAGISAIENRVESIIESIAQGQRDLLLARYGIEGEYQQGLMEPVELVAISTADKRERIGELIGGMLPYMLIFIILLGAMYPALDLGVGEKERGTMETLLLTPVTRFEIVLAKFLVTFSTGFIAVFLALVSMSIWLTVFGDMEKLQQLLGAFSTLTLTDVGLMVLILLPIAAIFASLMLAFSVYARNFKEAQNYMSPIMLVAILPVMVSILPGIKLDWFWAMIPVTNASLAIKELVKGTIDYSMLAVIFASSLVIAGALLAFCVNWFKREDVLFRT